ncbi:hypothetical protein V1525DRAFT_966 [Lipomyces kononenkoae]|uniref:Uncharacterized protein n=1 Tax=Lipomyces kononenkoae TaxID=34357 RepID=A0ACC3TB97_LIPKO
MTDQCSEADIRVIESMASLVPQPSKTNPVLRITPNNNALPMSSRGSSVDNDGCSSIAQDAAHFEVNESIGFWPSLRGVLQSFAENYAKELAPEYYPTFKPIPIEPNTEYADELDDVDESSESSDSEDNQLVLSTLGQNDHFQLTASNDWRVVAERYTTATPTTIPEFAWTSGMGPSIEMGTDIYREYTRCKEDIAKFEILRAFEEDLDDFYAKIANQLVAVETANRTQVSERLKDVRDAMQLKSVRLKESARQLRESILDQKKRAKQLETNLYHECSSPFKNSYTLEKNRLDIYYDAVQIMDEYDRLLAAEDITDEFRERLVADKKDAWREFRQWAANDSKSIATRTAKTHSFFFRTPRMSFFTT